MESDIISFVFSAFFAVKSKACAEVRSSMADYRDLASPTFERGGAHGRFSHAPKIQRLGEDFVSHCEPVRIKLRVDHQKAAAGMALIEHLQSANGLQATGSVVVAYFLGCFATGYYLVRARTGRDIREIGSGSTGARNVGRVLGKPGFMLTVLADFCKGALAVWVAREWTNDQRLVVLAMLAVVAGQIWPAQLRFRGGKGLATSFAALLLFDYRVALTILVVFLCGLAATRKSLFPAMFACGCLPFADGWFHRDGLTATLTAVLTAMILFAHRRNIGEEIAGLLARRGVAPKPESTKL
jgi:glycerol-3-phosphate acyltransferase PlsY